MQAAVHSRPCIAHKAQCHRLALAAPSRTRSLRPAAARAPQQVQQHQQHPQQQPQQHLQQQTCSSSAAWTALLPLSLAAALPAWAEELEGVDAAAAAIYEQDTGSSDLMVSLLAGSVFLLLLVVTGGVAYLSISNWLEKRQESEDQKVFKPNSGTTVNVSSDGEVMAPKRVRAKREKRGFGDKQ